MSPSINHCPNSSDSQWWQDRINQAYRSLANGATNCQTLIPPDTSGNTKHPNLILPGSFNPFHHGHTAMASYASDFMKQPVWFELSVKNADKPPLSIDQLISRLLPTLTVNSVPTFQPFGLVTTFAATFVEKARLFPGATFLTGADTIERVGDPIFYQSSVQKRNQALAEIESLDNSFLVFGRKTDGTFVDQKNLTLPKELNKLCEFVAESSFRHDVSSSQIRNEQGRNEF